jgi:predicted MFS family arabinose efflux permease
MLGHVLLSILVFSGMFTAYTYLADILERLAGFDGTVVGWCLMGFGAVGLIGNSLGACGGSSSADRVDDVLRVHDCRAWWRWCRTSIRLSVLAAAMGIWGITQAALFLVSHVRLMKAAPERQPLPPR